MSQVRLIRAPQLSDDVPYAYAARAPGDLVFTAGACRSMPTATSCTRGT